MKKVSIDDSGAKNDDDSYDDDFAGFEPFEANLKVDKDFGSKYEFTEDIQVSLRFPNIIGHFVTECDSLIGSQTILCTWH